MDLQGNGEERKVSDGARQGNGRAPPLSHPAGGSRCSDDSPEAASVKGIKAANVLRQHFTKLYANIPLGAQCGGSIRDGVRPRRQRRNAIGRFILVEGLE